MGRNFVLVLALVLVGLSGCAPESPFELSKSTPPMDLVLLPHHLIVKSLIEQSYAEWSTETWPQIIIISPDHFHTGTTHISTPSENEFGYTIHRDYALATWPNTPVSGYMIQNEATEQEIDELSKRLADTEALFIFSIDFSHYLPGDVSHVHDLRSMDILASRSVSEARSIEADCPTALELMLKLLEAKGETLDILRNTNPAYDAKVDTFENTTHIFARSRDLGVDQSPPSRTVNTTMFFAHPRDWYLGKTQEDRYLYGYDEVLWNQGGSDHALVQTDAGTEEIFEFNYLE